VGSFLELGVREFGGRTISFGCARSRVARIVEKISAVHPGEVRGARSGSIVSSPFATLKNEDQPPPSRETRSAESIQNSGPQYRRSVFSRPSRGDTWQQVEPSRCLAHRNSNAQKTVPSYPDTRSSESIQDLGPTNVG
jgi:hypothetical protein